MRDMFYEYDNNVAEPTFQPVMRRPQSQLESDGSACIVHNIKGNEIGVKIKHNHEFELYFYILDLACLDDKSFFDLLDASTLVFEVYSGMHKLELQKTFAANSAFDDRASAFCVKIDKSEAEKLAIDSYRMRILLAWPGGDYELYSESNGLLIVR